MKANEWCGEVVIILNSKNHALRPSFNALHAIERELNLSFFSLAEKIAGGNLTLDELSVIISLCADGITLEYVRENLVNSGLEKLFTSVADMFSMALEGLDEKK